MHPYVYFGLQSNGEKTEVAVELSLSELLLKTSVFIRTTEQIPHRFLVLWPGFPVALVFLVKTKNLICQHFMKDMVLPCNPELSWVIKGRPSYRFALSLLTPIPLSLRFRSRDFRRGPIKRSKLHPKDKVKSTIQSPQLFGPQNGAQQNQQAAVGFICS